MGASWHGPGGWAALACCDEAYPSRELERRGPRWAISQAMPSMPLPASSTPRSSSARLSWTNPIDTVRAPRTMRARQQS